MRRSVRFVDRMVLRKCRIKMEYIISLPYRIFHGIHTRKLQDNSGPPKFYLETT